MRQDDIRYMQGLIESYRTTVIEQSKVIAQLDEENQRLRKILDAIAMHYQVDPEEWVEENQLT